MPRTSFDDMRCSIARTLNVIGGWWTPLVLRDLAIGVTRFDAIQRDLGISRKVLSQRLAALVEHGIVEQVAYQEHPPRHDYVLTEKGADLAMVLLAMQAWGDRWVFGRADAPVILRHETCGNATEVLLACTECGEELRPDNVTLLPGPGLEDGPGTSEAAAALERLRVASGSGSG